MIFTHLSIAVLQFYCPRTETQAQLDTGELHRIILRWLNLSLQALGFPGSRLKYWFHQNHEVESHQWLLDFNSKNLENKSSHVQEWEAEDNINTEGRGGGRTELGYEALSWICSSVAKMSSQDWRLIFEWLAYGWRLQLWSSYLSMKGKGMERGREGKHEVNPLITYHRHESTCSLLTQHPAMNMGSLDYKAVSKMSCTSRITGCLNCPSHSTVLCHVDPRVPSPSWSPTVSAVVLLPGSLHHGTDSSIPLIFAQLLIYKGLLQEVKPSISLWLWQIKGNPMVEWNTAYSFPCLLYRWHSAFHLWVPCKCLGQWEMS